MRITLSNNHITRYYGSILKQGIDKISLGIAEDRIVIGIMKSLVIFITCKKKR